MADATATYLTVFQSLTKQLVPNTIIVTNKNKLYGQL